MKKVLTIVLFWFPCVKSFGQANSSILLAENVKYFSVGSFVTFNPTETPKTSNYKETSYSSPDGGSGVFLKFRDDEYSVSKDHFTFTLKLFPNPSTGNFSIETNAKESLNIFIYDVLGSLVFQSLNVTAQYKNIDLSSKAKGVYIVKTICGNDINMNRLVIE